VQFGEIPTTAKIILAMETSNSFCFWQEINFQILKNDS
jgi:hypothetical protein